MSAEKHSAGGSLRFHAIQNDADASLYDGENNTRHLTLPTMPIITGAANLEPQAGEGREQPPEAEGRADLGSAPEPQTCKSRGRSGGWVQARTCLYTCGTCRLALRRAQSERGRPRGTGYPGTGQAPPCAAGRHERGRALRLQLSVRASSDGLSRFLHDCCFCPRFSYKIRLRYGRFTV